MEYIKGEIYANIYTNQYIVRISPETGEVIGLINFEGLLNPKDYDASVFNGIAWDEDNDRLFVTGKFWPKLFEVEIVLPE